MRYREGPEKARARLQSMQGAGGGEGGKCSRAAGSACGLSKPGRRADPGTWVWQPSFHSRWPGLDNPWTWEQVSRPELWQWEWEVQKGRSLNKH